MRRDSIIFIVSLLVWPIFLLTNIALAVDTRPNFVWIIADDMSPDIGAYGAAEVKTPNLDRLAAHGRRFARAYATAPVCSSSRSAFILGCYQTTTGLHPHDVENPQPLPDPYLPLPKLLRDAGYWVTNSPAPDSMRSGKVIKKAKTHYNFAHDANAMFDNDDWKQRKPGQPFFAQFQITEPHRPFPIPDSLPDEDLNRLLIPPHYPNHPLMRRDWYAYLRSVEMVDYRVGMILDQLEKEGAMENTFVIFFADHGRPMPWGKQWLTVEGLQVPLIVAGPGIKKQSVESRLVSLIDLAPSLLSLAGLSVPEWMEGLPMIDEQSSRNLSRRNHVFAARDRCGDAEDRVRAVISIDAWFVKNFFPNVSHLNWSSYKEESYPGMPLLRSLQAAGKLNQLQSAWLAPTRSELEYYDLRNDPLGINNLAQDPLRKSQVTMMNAVLTAWMRSTGDRGMDGDPSTEPPLAEIQKAKRANYEKVWTKRISKSNPSDEERVAWWQSQYHLD